MAKIKLQTTQTIQEAFKDFLISRKSKGLTDKTLESYQFHFHAIAFFGMLYLIAARSIGNIRDAKYQSAEEWKNNQSFSL